MPDSYRISIEALENGFTVECPDVKAIAAKRRDAKKQPRGSYSPYIGDCTKKFAAKNMAEVLKHVRSSLEELQEQEFTTAFAEAAAPKR